MKIGTVVGCEVEWHGERSGWQGKRIRLWSGTMSITSSITPVDDRTFTQRPFQSFQRRLLHGVADYRVVIKFNQSMGSCKTKSSFSRGVFDMEEVFLLFSNRAVE